MMDNKENNQGVACEVSECYYHSGSNCCTASKIEVCNCKDCKDNGNETFCSTFREKF